LGGRVLLGEGLRESYESIHNRREGGKRERDQRGRPMSEKRNQRFQREFFQGKTRAISFFVK
jgi:hypothetical protein